MWDKAVSVELVNGHSGNRLVVELEGLVPVRQCKAHSYNTFIVRTVCMY